MAPQPFTLNVPDAALTDLKIRLAQTRFPDAAPGEPVNDPGLVRDRAAKLK